MTLRHTPLHSWHVQHGAKTADFGGWDMPIEYSGVVAEHTAVREHVGMFDVSHMGKLHICGAGAVVWLNTMLTNDLGRISAGQAQYSMLLNSDGGVIDDLIVYVLADDDVWIVPNASNADAVFATLTAGVVAGITIDNLHDELGIIAVQGPESPVAVQAVGLPTDMTYMSAVQTTWNSADVLVCRSGYTGETGFEIIAPVASLLALWERLNAADALPCGLGARDTLRLEMGYPLHGHELSTSISPVEAGLGWAVGWDKPTFVGRVALVAQKADGHHRRRCALRMTERGIPRADMKVLRGEREIGMTTSGTFSPTLKAGIALALVDEALQPGDTVEIDVRGRRIPAVVVKLPFINA